MDPTLYYTLSVILLSASISLVIIFLITLSRRLFYIYRRIFLRRVGLGLRDAFLFMDPQSLLILTFTVALIITLFWIMVLGWVTGVIIFFFILISPILVITFLKKRRSNKFEHQLPDVLESMSTAMRSGHGLMKAMSQIVENKPDPIAQEFSQILSEYRVGRDLDEALDDLQRRVAIEDIILFVSSVKIHRSIGGNLADTFYQLAKTLRERRGLQRKVKSLTGMAQAQSWVAVIIPVFASYGFYLAEPEAMSLLFTTPLGNIVLVIGLIMVAIGKVAMNKLGRISI